MIRFMPIVAAEMFVVEKMRSDKLCRLRCGSAPVMRLVLFGQLLFLTVGLAAETNFFPIMA